MRVLLVKTSSLGDLIHSLPALTDAQHTYPDLRVDWVAEEAFAEIPTWHPAVERVIPIALRRWRKAKRATWHSGELAQFWQALRVQHYDVVIDAQGLVGKSAWVARAAHGVSHGLDRHSAREPLAALFYQHRHRVDTAQHAIERVRQLWAAALNYHYDAEQLDYGLTTAQFDRPASDGDYLVFLHGTSWPSKRLATEHWIALARLAEQHGLKVYLPWGSVDEQRTAHSIAAACAHAEVLPRCTLSQLAGYLAGAVGVIGVDTGLAHLGAALGVPGVTLYNATFPHLTGARGIRQVCVQLGATSSVPPDTVGLNVEQHAQFDALAVWQALECMRAL